MKIAELWVEITGNDAALNRTLLGVQARLLGLASVGRRAGGGLMTGLAGGALTSDAYTIGLRLGTALRRGITVGVAVGGYALFKGIEGAASLTEAVNKIGAVYAEQGKQVIAASDEMAAAFGLPKRAFLDAASGFGLIAQGMGQTQKASAAFSIDMVKLAADAGRFHDVNFKESLEKIRAALAGEIEPTRVWGIMMSEAALKAQAVSMGLAKMGQELSNSAKLAAASAIIHRGLAPAMGALARESGGAKAQMEEFRGRIENLADAIGVRLLPAFGDMVKAVNASLIGMGESLNRGEGAFFDFVEGVKSGLETLSFGFTNFGDITDLVWLNMKEFGANVGNMFNFVGSVVGEVANLIWSYFSGAIQAVMTMIGNLGENIKTFMNEIFDYIATLGKDPIEIHFKGIMDEVKMPGSGASFVMPKLELTSFQKEKDLLLKSIAERKKIQLDLAKAAGIVTPAKPMTAGPEGGKKEKKSETRSLEDFAKHLQEGIFGKDSAKETAAATKRTAAATETMAKKLARIPSMRPATAAAPE